MKTKFIRIIIYKAYMQHQSIKRKFLHQIGNLNQSPPIKKNQSYPIATADGDEDMKLKVAEKRAVERMYISPSDLKYTYTQRAWFVTDIICRGLFVYTIHIRKGPRGGGSSSSFLLEHNTSQHGCLRNEVVLGVVYARNWGDHYHHYTSGTSSRNPLERKRERETGSICFACATV